MADLLERVLHEVRERKERARDARTLARLVADGTLERVELPAGTLGYRVAEAAGDERSAGEGQQ